MACQQKYSNIDHFEFIRPGPLLTVKYPDRTRVGGTLMAQRGQLGAKLNFPSAPRRHRKIQLLVIPGDLYGLAFKWGAWPWPPSSEAPTQSSLKRSQLFREVLEMKVDSSCFTSGESHLGQATLPAAYSLMLIMRANSWPHLPQRYS